MENCRQNVSTNKPTPSFLQAGCLSCRPTNSVKALKALWSGTLYFYPHFCGLLMQTEIVRNFCLYSESAQVLVMSQCTYGTRIVPVGNVLHSLPRSPCRHAHLNLCWWSVGHFIFTVLTVRSVSTWWYSSYCTYWLELSAWSALYFISWFRLVYASCFKKVSTT